VGCRGLDVCFVTGEHGAPRFGKIDNDRIDSGSMSGTPTQLGSPSRGLFRDDCIDDTGLDEPVGVGVAPA
jgi:hypothetical protein